MKVIFVGKLARIGGRVMEVGLKPPGFCWEGEENDEEETISRSYSAGKRLGDFKGGRKVLRSTQR